MSRTMGREGGWNVEEGEFVEQANDDVDVRTPLISDPCHPRFVIKERPKRQSFTYKRTIRQC